MINNIKYKLIELLTYLLERISGYYIVQTVHMEDVRQATGFKKLNYSHDDMRQLADELTENTYNGDEWHDIIREFNNDIGYEE